MPVDGESVNLPKTFLVKAGLLFKKGMKSLRFSAYHNGSLLRQQPGAGCCLQVVDYTGSAYVAYSWCVMMTHALGCPPLHRRSEHPEPRITSYDPSYRACIRRHDKAY